MARPNLQPPPETEWCDVGRQAVPFVQYPASRRPNGESVALLHGIGMPPTHWGELPVTLAAMGYDVTAIGVANHNWQNGLPTMDRYAAATGAAIDSLIGRPAHIVGVSWGGLLAQQVALDYPDKVRKLVAAATYPAVPLPFLRLPNFRTMLTVTLPWQSPATNDRIFGADAVHNRAAVNRCAHLFDHPIDAANHASQQTALLAIAPLLWRAAAGGFFGRNHHSETTFMYSNDDPLVPDINVEIGASLLGAATHKVDGGGHVFLLSRPQESAETIASILSSPILSAAA